VAPKTPKLHIDAVISHQNWLWTGRVGKLGNGTEVFPLWARFSVLGNITVVHPPKNDTGIVILNREVVARTIVVPPEYLDFCSYLLDANIHLFEDSIYDASRRMWAIGCIGCSNEFYRD
jgi:hypothetical protein